MDKFIIGTRGSQLALYQANKIRGLLVSTNQDLDVAIQIITTKGDSIQNVPLPKIGGKGLFTEEIENELLHHRIDLAVHSLKDLPSELPNDLCYAGSPERADVRDALISTRWKSLKEMPDSGTIATGSTRRKAQILEQKPAVNFTDLRGNIDTRLRKLDEQHWDGIIMAAAALQRLELADNIAEYLDPKQFTPAVGQGAIGLEICENRPEVLAIVKRIIHGETTRCCKAERVFMEILEGGCSTPLGAWCRIIDDEAILTGYVANTEGTQVIRETLSCPITQMDQTARELAESFIQRGARKILEN